MAEYTLPGPPVRLRRARAAPLGPDPRAAPRQAPRGVREGREHRAREARAGPRPPVTSAPSTSSRRTSRSTSRATSSTRSSGRTSPRPAARSPRASSPRPSTSTSATSTRSRPSSPRPRTTSRARVGARCRWEPLGHRLIVEQVYDHQGNVGQGGPPLLVVRHVGARLLPAVREPEDRVGRRVLEHRRLVRRRVALREGPPYRPRHRQVAATASFLARSGRLFRPQRAKNSGSGRDQPPLTGGITATSSPSASVGRRAVGRLVAVEPDARAVEDLGEAVAVAGARAPSSSSPSVDGGNSSEARPAASRADANSSRRTLSSAPQPAWPGASARPRSTRASSSSRTASSASSASSATRSRSGPGSASAPGSAAGSDSGLGRGRAEDAGAAADGVNRLDLHAARLGGRADSVRGQAELEQPGLVGELVLEPGQPGHRGRRARGGPGRRAARAARGRRPRRRRGSGRRR